MKNGTVLLICCAVGLAAFTAKTQSETDFRIHSRQISFNDSGFPNSNIQSFSQTKNFIYSKLPVTPFRQWGSNNGYCGEVSLIEAGMNQGQWMSQYNARLICGTGLSQSGPDGFCSANESTPNYNAQLLLENPLPGDSRFASASLCLQNARLAYQTFDSASEPTGMAGYQSYLSWIKAQLIAGGQVTIGILNFKGEDPQYDHEVTVTRIGTNHDVSDSAYYDDDVLYFDSHGNGGPAYDQGYTFQSLAKSREDANNPVLSGAYSILIPDAAPVYTGAGGDGIHSNPRPIIAKNYGFSVYGPSNSNQTTLPTTLSITSSSTRGQANSPDGDAGLRFENPELSEDCTNLKPESWMDITLQANVSGLVPGVAYNLYEYDFDGVSGVGADAALAVPEKDFNANAGMANQPLHFVATETTFTKTIQTTSDKIIVLRCVPASAP